LQMNCKYSCLGCKQILKLNTREEHIKNLCEYRPCPCPVPGCMKYKDLKHALQQHLENEHGVHMIPFEWNNTSGVYEAEISMRVPIASLTGLVLYNGDEKVRLLLHSEAIVNLGHLFYCTTFEDHAVKYDIKVDLNHDGQSFAVVVNALAENTHHIQNWKRYAFIFPREDGDLDVKLRVFLINR
jgi:hypothetical protein